MPDEGAYTPPVFSARTFFKTQNVLLQNSGNRSRCDRGCVQGETDTDRGKAHSVAPVHSEVSGFTRREIGLCAGELLFEKLQNSNPSA